MRDATFLFTDIEGSTRLWEEQPERMRVALARHDEIARHAVESHGGRVVKMTGDGVHAVFDDAADAVRATVQLQEALASPEVFVGIALRVRCGLHGGPSEGRDGDFFGSAVNRAARVMSVAHGGQMLVSEAVARGLDGRVPDGLALRDLGLVRLRDLSRPERIYQIVHPRLRRDFPAVRSLERTPNNLPNQLTSFVGREREQRELGRLLGSSRLVTVLGMGGIGKTRLALQVAADAIDRFDDGVWLVELGTVVDPRRVAAAAAAVLGVQEEPGQTLFEAILRHLRERRVLLVLDNCEHVLAASAEMVRALLEASPHSRMLATSREPLQLPGEACYPLTALSVPGPLAAEDPVALQRYDAVRLFLERARAARHDFTLHENNAALVSAICHRLDGIPLALELAAARVRGLAIGDLAARLKDRFRLLTSADPTAAPRQRTMLAMIDWSHDLLPVEERVLFRRLAVFAGGWTLEAAEQVCEGDPLDAGTILDALARLTEKSLLVQDDEATRYGMLETVREYALRRLADAGETEAVSARHARFHVELAVAAKQHLVGPQRAPWLAKLDAERANLFAAHAWTVRAPDGAADTLRLADALKMYWAQRGLLEIGHRFTEEALGHPSAADAGGLRGEVLFHLGQFRYFMGRYSDAYEPLQESVSIARQREDLQTLPRALQTLGVAALGAGDQPLAQSSLQEAVRWAKKGGDKRCLAGAVNGLAMLLRGRGEHRNARPLYEQAVAIAREAGDLEAQSVALLNVAMTCLDEGDLASGSKALRESLEIACGIGSSHATKSGLEVCAGLAAMTGCAAQAAVFFGAAEAATEKTSARRDPLDEKFLSTRIASARQDLGEAAFEAESARGSALSLDNAVAEARRWLVTAAAAASA